MRIAVGSRFAGDPSVPGPKYFQALARFGAHGEFVAAIDPQRAARTYDALLLGGGGDMNPRLWGGGAHPLSTLSPQARDESEIALIHAFIARGKRVLGVCRGIQVLAVATGGTLTAHLPETTDIDHENERAGHCVTFLCDGPGSPCAPLWVNSAHHQAVRTPGRGMKVFAVAPDGTIEGIFLPNIALGVQWHPERMDAHVCDGIWRWFLEK